MPARVEGTIYAEVDVRDYGDELEIIADMDDIVEIMEANRIEAGEMIEYLREGSYRLDRQDVIDWLEQESVFTIATIAKVCIQLMETEYRQAEEGRVEYRDRFVASEAEAQKVITHQ